MTTTDYGEAMSPERATGTSKGAWRHVLAVLAGLNLKPVTTRETVRRMAELAYNAGWAQGHQDGMTEAGRMVEQSARELRTRP